MRSRAGAPPRSVAASRAHSGFTFTELMIGMSVFMMVLSGVITSHVFGMKVFQLTQSKVAESQDTRKALDYVITDLRAAQSFQIGQGTSNTFVPVADGLVQTGNAVQIYPGTNTNVFVRYYGGASLRRVTNGTTTSMVLAKSLKTCLFQLEDFQANTLTNAPANALVKISLEFYYRLAFYTATTNLGESYLFETRVARREQD